MEWSVESFLILSPSQPDQNPFPFAPVPLVPIPRPPPPPVNFRIEINVGIVGWSGVELEFWSE